MTKLPTINTHTHIFTEKNIPPFIAKKFVPWPFYYLLHVGVVFRIFKFCKKIKEKILEPFWKFQNWVISSIRSTPVVRIFDNLISLILTLNVLLIIIKWSGKAEAGTWMGDAVDAIEKSFAQHLLFYNYGNIVQIIIIAALLFFYPSVAKMLWALARKLLSQLQYVPSKQALHFIQRYLTIAEFAKYKSQKDIFNRLIKMYDPGSKVVVLPMDMEYMKAGQPPQSYIDQLKEIMHYFEIKEVEIEVNGEKKIVINKQVNIEYMIPFVFVDPRRIRDDEKVDGKPFFDWDIEKKIEDDKAINWVVLKDCFLKDCLEGGNSEGKLNGVFKGVKIYPALGYFPFDESLLPLWAYCEQHNIPITTHCIEGTIFYRGAIKKKWLAHPVFKNSNGSALELRVKNNYELQLNFTHPLNYLVLLEDYYLAQVVGKCDNKIKRLFGYDETEKKISQNLNCLKINLAHYGGKEEWSKYLEADREDMGVELTENPTRGIELVKRQNPKAGENPELWTKPAWIWNKNYEWFSIISSMMLQYDNVYADISYILHNEEVKPLLYQVLHKNELLANKILFGTDFFVVRNHKSEKELYADLLAFIGEEKMDLIARANPDQFLRSG